MPEPVFLRVRDNWTPSSNSEEWIRLPTFPLSYLNIAIVRQQPSANTSITVDDMVSFITRIAVYVRGAAVFDASGRDAFVIGNMLYCRTIPYIKRTQGSTSNFHIANIFIPFSRKPLMPASGIKRVATGEALLYMRFGTVPSNTVLTIGAVGWRENEPEWTVKVSKYSQSIAATGPADIVIAPTGPVLGLVFREDNPRETANTTILDEVRLLVQGVEDTLISYDLDLLAGEQALTRYYYPQYADLQAIENLAAAYTQYATTAATQPATQVQGRYIALLLDELYDPDAVLAFPPGVDVRVRVNATATGSIDLFTIEMFTIPERAAAGSPTA